MKRLAVLTIIALAGTAAFEIGMDLWKAIR